MTERKISEPKGFQRATVAAALRTITSEDGPRRFLVADEVGLGKTVVARTVVEEMMKGRRRPVVVFYVSSNLNIAHQNRAKLLELLPTEDEQNAASAAADRLTLAANTSNRPDHDKLHLYTLTPDTSVPMYRRRGGFGRLEERALIFRLLKSRFPSLDTKEFLAKCRGSQAGDQSWNRAMREHEDLKGVRELQDRVLEALAEDNHLGLAAVDAYSLALAAEEKSRSLFMGSLRTALAKAVLQDVKPDLVIFDEFQKFREMLIDTAKSSPDPITLALRGGKPKGHGVLLLSATPYRLYSTRQEEAAGASHHQDFFELIRFLFGPDSKQPKEIERAFLEFGGMMLAKETPEFQKLESLRDELQRRLGRVMSRTERPKNGAQPAKKPHPQSEIKPEDLRVYRNWVARLQEGLAEKEKPISSTSPCLTGFPFRCRSRCSAADIRHGSARRRSARGAMNQSSERNSAITFRRPNPGLIPGNGVHPSPWVTLAEQADQKFSEDASGRSPWWSCRGEEIDRVFVVLPQSRQTIKFDQLSRLRWLYRLALGQPHQQDFIETVMQMPSDGREDYVLSLSAWNHFAIAATRKD